MANIISSKINKRYKIVTLDGQVINVGGSLTGGSQVKSVSSISIKYEIEEEEKKKDILSSKNKELLREVDNIDKLLGIKYISDEEIKQFAKDSKNGKVKGQYSADEFRQKYGQLF